MSKQRKPVQPATTKVVHKSEGKRRHGDARKAKREAARQEAAKHFHRFVPTESGDATFHGCKACGFGADFEMHTLVKAGV